MSDKRRNLYLMAMNAAFASMNYAFWHFVGNDFSLWCSGFSGAFVVVHFGMAFGFAHPTPSQPKQVEAAQS